MNTANPPAQTETADSFNFVKKIVMSSHVLYIAYFGNCEQSDK